MSNRNPTHYLHAISLLAYLGADEDGPVSIEDDESGRRALRQILADTHSETEGSTLEPDTAESALALVSAAIDLLDAAAVDAADVKAPDAGRRIQKAARHLMEAADALGAVARIEALEIEVARLRSEK